MGRSVQRLCALADARLGGWCPYQLTRGCPPYFRNGYETPIMTEVIAEDGELSLVEFKLGSVVHREWQQRFWPWLCCPFRQIDTEEGF